MSFCKLRGSVILLFILIQEPGVITAKCFDFLQKIVFMGLGMRLVMAVEVAAQTPGTRIRPNTIALWRWTSGVNDWKSESPGLCTVPFVLRVDILNRPCA